MAERRQAPPPLPARTCVAPATGGDSNETGCRLATVWLGGCSGCHMSFLDLDECLIELAERAELVYSPLIDVKEYPEGVDVVPGRGGGRQRGGPGEDPPSPRADPDRWSSFGDCAVTGNVTACATRSAAPAGAAGAPTSRTATCNAQIPSPRSCPRLLPTGRCRSTPSSRSTCYLPGCPPPADLIYAVLDDLLAGRRPDLPRRDPVRREQEAETMAREIVIDPVTRIEGHAKITIHLDDAGQVADAHFHVTEFRGFEKFCEGRPLCEMPAITARICGICPVSHLLASAKAGDADPGGAASRRPREAAPADEPGPDRPVARAELLPPLRPGPAARLGRRPGRRGTSSA